MSVAGDLVAKAQDWPGADKLSERLKKTIPPQFLEEGEEGGLGITPEQLQEMQQQLQQLSIENQELKMEKHNKERELDIKEYAAKAQMVRALSDHEVDQTQQSLDAIRLILDGAKTVDEQDIRREEFERTQDLQRSTLAAKSASGS